jgi:hypothetical protein
MPGGEYTVAQRAVQAQLDAIAPRGGSRVADGPDHLTMTSHRDNAQLTVVATRDR